MDINTLKGLKLEDLLDVDFSQLKEDEIAYVEKRLIKNVNRRLSKLKQAGLIASSRLTSREKKGMTAYKPPKGRVRTTRGGKTVRINVRNKRIKSANKARDILLKKASTLSGVKERDKIYLENINKTLSDSFGRTVKLDKRRLKRVGRLMKKAEELYGLGVTNKKFSGSPYILQMIVDIVKSREYVRNEEAEEIINEAIEQGYEAGQRLLNALTEEDEDGLDFIPDDLM